jgi:hypothetical protein
VVHWYHNIFRDVPTTKVKEVAATLKAIHAQEDAGDSPSRTGGGLLPGWLLGSDAGRGVPTLCLR